MSKNPISKLVMETVCCHDLDNCMLRYNFTKDFLIDQLEMKNEVICNRVRQEMDDWMRYLTVALWLEQGYME